MDNYSEIADRFALVSREIAEAAEAAGRDPSEVKLVVVTKGQPVERIRAVVAAGARCLGENYVEEAQEKIQALAGEGPVEWRMIGHLQSRKARQAAALFDALDSLDSLKLAGRLNIFSEELNRSIPVLLEFNLSGEQSKTGWPAWDEAAWPALGEPLAGVLALPGLVVDGLMTIPPFFDDPELSAPYFQKLRRLQDCLRSWFPGHGFDELSMGMSGDFKVAIREGASMVRIGTAIMGERIYRV